jgi:hypothetical protein
MLIVWEIKKYGVFLKFRLGELTKEENAGSFQNKA